MTFTTGIPLATPIQNTTLESSDDIELSDRLK